MGARWDRGWAQEQLAQGVAIGRCPSLPALPVYGHLWSHVKCSLSSPVVHVSDGLAK